MVERRPWKMWSIFLFFLLGNTQFQVAQSVDQYGPAKGDYEGSESEPIGNSGLGFGGIQQRHDGYVKGETPTIPKTSFSCSAQPYNPGLYADMETQCQVYHVCFEDRQESFLCGPGTNFNQKILACDFWYNFECQNSASFYGANSEIGQVPQTVYRPTADQSVHGNQTPRPAYPSYPQQEQRPIPDRGSYQPPRPDYPNYPQQEQRPIPDRGSYKPPRPDFPSYPQQEQRPIPDSGRYQPPRVNLPPPPVKAEPPRVVPQPPKIQPQPPRIQPQPPRIQPQPPRVVVPQPPRVQPQPPRIQPQPPRIPESSFQPPRIQPPSPRPQPPSFQQEVDNDYNFEGDYRPQRPINLPPPPRPAYPVSPRPVFPPVVSPPRIARPPLTPVVIRRPGEPSRTQVVSRPPSFPQIPRHPDSEFKGSTDYRPPQQPPRIPQPSSPVNTGYPNFPPPRPVVQRPISRPAEKAYQPPHIQQEHVDVDYIPPPPPPPRQPSRPSTNYVPPPPPPPPIQQEIIEPDYVRPRPPAIKQPSRPSIDYIPPPPPPRQPSKPDYQPPSSPSIITQQQTRPSSPPSRPQVIVSTRPQQPPQRPRPVFPPISDHPNANIKGGPGYQQPPPQQPRFEPTRINNKPSGSTSQTGYQPPPQPPKPKPQPPTGSQEYQPPISVKPVGVKQPTQTGQVIKKPQPDRVKQPSQTVNTGYQPPRTPSVQVVRPPSFPIQIEHPDAGLKGSGYEEPAVPRQPQRVISPSTPISGIKRPVSSTGYQRPVVTRPQPPSSSSQSIKTSKPAVDNQVYQPPIPQPPAIPPSRVKLPSQSEHVLSQHPNRPQQPLFPAPRPEPIDHPNANIKGGPGYQQIRPQPQPSRVPSREPSRIPQPSRPVVILPPSSPSTSTQQKTSPPSQGHSTGTGRGYQPQTPQRPYRPRGDEGYPQQEIIQEVYEPQRRPSVISTPKVDPISSGVKDTSYQKRPPSSSQIVRVKQQQPQQDYNTGSSYKSGPNSYPKPEFQQPGKPYQPVSTPSRSSQTTKQGSPSQTRITHQNKPQTSTYPGSSSATSNRQVNRPRQPGQADYPYEQVPGHQPPHQPQVFPHRDNPDHPNASIKGSTAYRPPPPADYQPAGSEIQEQRVIDVKDSAKPEPAPSSLLGDIGAE